MKVLLLITKTSNLSNTQNKSDYCFLDSDKEENCMLKEDSLSSITESYADSYTIYDQQWRLEGGRNKAANIVSLCASLKVKSLLDIGSGDGAVLEWLSKENFVPEIYAVEIADSAIERLIARKLPHLKEVKKFDGYHIPFADKAFELSTCSHVLEHVEHPRLVLREIARVSEYQFFEIPIDFSFFVDKRTAHFLAYGHINVFTPSLFKFLLKSEGFEIIKEDFRFYSNEIIKMTHASKKKQLISRIKNGLIRAIPFLKKIKPNVYVVLCKKSTTTLPIFH